MTALLTALAMLTALTAACGDDPKPKPEPADTASDAVVADTQADAVIADTTASETGVVPDTAADTGPKSPEKWNVMVYMASLADFIKWAADAYPADHHVLVLWDQQRPPVLTWFTLPID